MLSPGCDIPFDTPINNMVAISNFINGKFSSVEMLESDQQFHEEEEAVFEDVEVKSGQVFI